jgi:hypothetical protein
LEDAGDRPARDNQGDREGGEDQSVIRQPGAEVDALLQRLATLMSLFPLSWPAQLSIFEVHPMGREDGNR